MHIALPNDVRPMTILSRDGRSPIAALAKGNVSTRHLAFPFDLQEGECAGSGTLLTSDLVSTDAGLCTNGHVVRCQVVVA